MEEIKYRKYKNFSGPVVYGAHPLYTPDDNDTFLEKLVYVTSKVESGGFYGSVFMADGTGITAGLCQHASVLPRSMRWGDLWKLIAFLDSFFPISYYDLGQLLEEHGWTFQPDGVLRDYETNVPVSTHLFRTIVTPTDGAVPNKGPKWELSKRWCQAVYAILVHPGTHRAQFIYECQYLQKMIEHTHFRGVLGGKKVSTIAFPNGVTHPAPFASPHLELAMLVFLSFAVNAPKWAYQAFDKTLKNGRMPTDFSFKTELFARSLVKNLELAGGTKWDDDRKYGRYQRTRRVLKDLFDDELLADVMPYDLPE